MIRYACEYELLRYSAGASGYDLRCTRSSPRVLAPGERWVASTSLHLELPHGVEGQIRSRSGLARDHGVIVLNAPGTIDSDYRGEVGVTLINLGDRAWTLTPGERVAQIVFCPVFATRIGERFLACGLGDTRVSEHHSAPLMHALERVASPDLLETTERGSSGHGSTGR